MGMAWELNANYKKFQDITLFYIALPYKDSFVFSTDNIRKIF